MNHHYNSTLKSYAREHRNFSISRAEKFIWKAALSRNQLGVKFKRQRPVDQFIVDFFCQSLGLIIEIDGSSHFKKAEYDLYKQKQLEELGFTVIRFPEGEVLNQFEEVYTKLLHVIYCLQEEKKLMGK